MTTPILSLKNLNKKISEDFQLYDINMDFYPGEVTALIGENGSGKSSLMKIISGLLSPDSGKILWNGEKIKFKSIYEGKQKGIYYVPQETSLFENLTVVENIFIDSISYRKNIYDIYHIYDLLHYVESIFKKLNIKLNPHEYVKNLNQSQRQILSFTKAYVINAEFTIFDEPSSSLTDIENDILFEIIKLLKDNGSSIVLISHKIQRIIEIGDKLTILKDGSILEQGDIKDFTKERIIKIMSSSANDSKYPKLHFDSENEILKLENISFKNVLKDISFSLYRQETLGIIGGSSSGKDRLIEILFGLVKPDNGNIFLGHSNVNINHPKDAMEKGFALVPEDKINNSIFHQMELKDNLTISSLKRFSRNLILDEYILNNVAKNYIAKLGISPGNPEDKAIFYSGGNQQKVAFAKSLMHLGKIYILDEPTRGIDIVSKNDIYNIMNDLLINESSIILFSSDFEEVLGMCDRILVLSEGKLIAELDSRYATREEIVYYLTL